MHRASGNVGSFSIMTPRFMNSIRCVQPKSFMPCAANSPQSRAPGQRCLGGRRTDICWTADFAGDTFLEYDLRTCSFVQVSDFGVLAGGTVPRFAVASDRVCWRICLLEAAAECIGIACDARVIQHSKHALQLIDGRFVLFVSFFPSQ